MSKVLPFSPVSCTVEKPKEVVLAPGLRDALDIVKGLLAWRFGSCFLGRDGP